MKKFYAALNDANPDPAGRAWVYAPYDQLSDQIGPLAGDPQGLGLVLVESPWKAARRPYHKQKLALILANQRHFALEQAARGVRVRYVVHDGPYAEALAPVIDALGPLKVMRPAERELRADLADLVESGGLEPLPHAGWLTTAQDFAACGARPWRMDRFYRAVRQRTGILMDGKAPVGGRYSFDGENRRAWPGDPPAPTPPRFEPDAISEEVGALIEARFGDHPGTLDLAALPASAADAERLWAWAKAECMPTFGPFEDAMSVRSSGLFHTRVAQLLNLHRLLPRRVVDEVAAADWPLASREGFIRQVIGWREFVRHVHEATDGFAEWGARPSHLGAGRELPPAYWGAASGLNCLDTVVADVWREGYSHHITRLMVLGNIAQLLDVDPRALSDWFWVAYVDAYDWVVEPNVLGMATFALGDLMTTKPYVSGSNYIDKMSDYCGPCAFDPKKDCPLRALYWAYLDRHADQLTGNRRLAMPLRSLAKRSDAQRRADGAVFERTAEVLARGETLTPEG